MRTGSRNEASNGRCQKREAGSDRSHLYTHHQTARAGRARLVRASTLSRTGKRNSGARGDKPGQTLFPSAQDYKICVTTGTSHLVGSERTIRRSRNFDNLFNLIERTLKPVRGIGELYLYDTALRIGAKLNLSPTKVYLRAGTRDGARALGADATATLDMGALRLEFHCLEPYEIEHILCIFKGELRLAATSGVCRISPAAAGAASSQRTNQNSEQASVLDPQREHASVSHPFMSFFIKSARQQARFHFCVVGCGKQRALMTGQEFFHESM